MNFYHVNLNSVLTNFVLTYLFEAFMKSKQNILVLSLCAVSAATLGAQPNIDNAIIMGHVCNQSGYTNECNPSIGNADNADNVVINAGANVTINGEAYDDTELRERVYANEKTISEEGQIRHESDKRLLELRMDGAEQKINWLEQEAKNIRNLVAGAAAFAAIHETDFNSFGFGFASDMYGITGQPEKFKETGMIMTGVAVAY